jgi:hypothetical protein
MSALMLLCAMASNVVEPKRDQAFSAAGVKQKPQPNQTLAGVKWKPVAR